MEIKTIEIDEGFPLEVVNKKVMCYKPKRNKEGRMQYKDCLVYLARVLPQNEPTLPVIIGLASFSLNNVLSEKQRKLANRFIYYWEEKGIL